MKVKIENCVFNSDTMELSPLSKGWDAEIEDVISKQNEMRQKTAELNKIYRIKREWTKEEKAEVEKNRIDGPEFIKQNSTNEPPTILYLYSPQDNERFVLEGNFKEFGRKYIPLAVKIISNLSDELNETYFFID